MLRLPTIRARFAEAADRAEHDQLSYRGFLAELLMAECEDRDHRRAEVPHGAGEVVGSRPPWPWQRAQAGRSLPVVPGR